MIFKVWNVTKRVDVVISNSIIVCVEKLNAEVYVTNDQYVIKQSYDGKEWETV